MNLKRSDIRPVAALPLIILFAPLGFAAPADVGAGSLPRDVVEALQNELIETLKVGEELGFSGRYARLEPTVRDTHRIESIARLTVGAYWSEMDEAVREAFVEKFGQFIVSGYAAKFRRFHNEYFEWVEEQPHRRGQHIIRTKLILEDGESIDFNYVLSRQNDEWRIINVAVKGISDLAMKRAEFTGIIEKKGYGALIKAVSDKVAEIKERQESDESS